MKTRQLSEQEMQPYISRFRELTPQSENYAKLGVPKEAYEMMTAKTLYLLMAPEKQGGPMAQQPAIKTDDKMSVIIAKCPPGDRPGLHAHHRTKETFMCLDGRFRIRWNDKGENEVFLEPYDMIAVPPGVVRDFTNVSDQDAHLLVIITGESEADFDDIELTPEEADRFRARFGDEMFEKMRALGTSFDAGVES